jgi:hypothetical protein
MKKFFASIKQYPSAIVGTIMILLLVVLSIYVVITIPYARRFLNGAGVRRSRGHPHEQPARPMSTGLPARNCQKRS